MLPTTPESQGIPSKSIIALLAELEAKRLPMHSLLVMRHGNLVSETYWKPFSQTSLQRMYSVTKSFVSIAIGMLAEQKKISLDDKICSYFPEKMPEHPSKELADTTIRDMLRMESCHMKTTYKLVGCDDWVGSFFSVPADHAPGAFFSYDTSATHVLGALVEKITGMELLTFLREQWLDGIGFSKEAKMLKDPQGTTLGGSGLLSRARDLLKAAKDLTREESACHAYFLEASKKHVNTWPDAAGGLKDLQQGYGYYIWRTTHDSFCFYGMGGQLVVFVPKKDVIVVTTAWVKHIHGGLQGIFDAIWRMVEAISDQPLAENSIDLALLRKMERSLELQVAPGTTEGMEKVCGTYTLGENETRIRTIAISKREKELAISINGIYCGNAGIGCNHVGSFLFQEGWKAATSAALDMQGNLVIHTQILFPDLGDLTLILSKNSLRVSLCLEPKIAISQGAASCSFAPLA